jgi:signal peptidase II
VGSVASEPSPPTRPRARRGWLILAAAVVVVALDQLSKHWAVTRLSPEGSPGIHVLGSLWFRLAFNSGMSFSLGTGMGPVVGLIALAIIGVLFWLSRSIHSRVQLVLVGIVMGGAAGNLCDRLFRAGSGFLGGHVVDFVYLRWWPTFNVADSAIVVGGIALAVLLTFWPDEPEGRPAPPSPDAPEASAGPAPDVSGVGAPTDRP